MRQMLPTNRALLFALLLGLLPLAAQAQPNAWINELHYDNTGDDTGEFVEVVVQNPGSFDLGDLEVRLYNDSGTRYDNIGDVANDFTEGSTSGAFTVYTWEPSSLQNGPGDGMALCYDDTAIQVLSYEGTFTGSDGDCADGITSTDIGVDEDPAPDSGNSLQLVGSGAAYGGFSWSGPEMESPGTFNDGQTLLSSPIVVDDDGTENFSSLQAALDAAGNGYTLDVRAGTYSEEITVDVPAAQVEGPNAGTPGYGSRGNEATIEGQVVISASNAVFKGFDVSPPPATSNPTGEALRIGSGSNAPNDVVVKNNIVRDFSEEGIDEDVGGIVAFGGVSTPLENVTISNNLVEDVTRTTDGYGAVGISIQGNVSGATVTENTVRNISKQTALYGFGIVVRGSGNPGGPPSGITVTNNDISSVLSDSGPFAGVGFGVEGGSVASVTENDFSNTELQAEDKTFSLDLIGFIDNNTLDRAAVILNGSGGVKDEDAAQRVYSSIGAPASRASTGETVQVYDGTYAETVFVNKPLTLQDASTPTVNAFNVAADNVTIDGFKITGGTIDGLTKSVGIFVQKNTSGHTFKNNNLTLSSRRGDGVRIRSNVSSTEVKNNNISDWDVGIVAVEPGGSVSVTDNCITGNTRGVQSSGGQTISATGNWWGASDGPGGEFDGSGDPAISFRGGNITENHSTQKVGACPSSAQCDTPTLALSGEDQVTDDRDGVSNTIQDTDGIDEFTFTTLEGFEVESITPSSNYSNTGDTWEWEGTEGDQPTSVDFTLNATKSEATYFVKIFDNCDAGRKMAEIDPRFELGPDITQARLAGPAPNPFSGQATIEFALPEQTRVTVSVYDMMGRKVATLVDGTRQAGTHTLSWNGQSDGGQALASGVYFMRMQADGQSSTRRVTIVR